MITPDAVLEALRELGLEGHIRTDLHVAEILVTSTRGRGYVVRFLQNGKATVSTPLDILRQRMCRTVAEVLAAVEGDAPL
jgi:hypothetical protein